jgi:hypothetical protein
MPEDEKISPQAKRAIIVVLVVIALLSIYANVQRLRRDKIETVIVTPVEAPSPSPSPTAP